eukprot:TRINITY_DN2737_c0_g2_i3.p1 TRINITY_DN2737_c0_g2~~TRINITY_DN2737_c0_g2_i3.p1  ORF type:complete len:330 (-),score=59.77 TRINITY_DN2737_c0_g2_i3:87-1076(-)
MLKYALFFTGIIKSPSAEIMQQLLHFTDTGVVGEPRGLRLSLSNRGPSRSGFASSSAVATTLLQVLYRCSGQTDIANDRISLGSRVLLFENHLGLKSGRQDVDGLLPGGFKVLHYAPTSEFLVPHITLWPANQLDVASLPSHLVLVDSGIPRPAVLDLRRGLNMRHWAFLSRQPHKYHAIQQSIGIHFQIVEAFSGQQWERLGALFLQYMALRAIIDPGAIQSVHDQDFGSPLLMQLFTPLRQQGLIYGGMFTGAMGGGVAMLVSTPVGQEMIDDNGQSSTRLDVALKMLSQTRTASGALPFARLRKICYSINVGGSVHSTKPNVELNV